jgi:hypothetical protein
MAKTTYRVVVRNDGRTSDVEMTEPGTQPRTVNTFNSEAEAWEWVNEQKNAAKFATQYEQRQRDKH